MANNQIRVERQLELASIENEKICGNQLNEAALNRRNAHLSSACLIATGELPTDNHWQFWAEQDMESETRPCRFTIPTAQQLEGAIPERSQDDF